MCPRHPSDNKVAETSTSVDRFLRRLQCLGKGHSVPKERGHKREKPVHFLISKMFPPTQEGTIWDVGCYYGDYQPRSLIGRSPWPHSAKSLQRLYEVGIWSLTQATSFEPMAAPSTARRTDAGSTLVSFCPVRPCLSCSCTFPATCDIGRSFCFSSSRNVFSYLAFPGKETRSNNFSHQ